MKELHSIIGVHRSSTLRNPNLQDIIYLIQQLNDDNFRIFWWHLNDEIEIEISTINNTRVLFLFTGVLGELGYVQKRALADPNYPLNQEIIEYMGPHTSPQEIYISLTVVKEKATEVATYFFQNDSPPPGSLWDMGDKLYTV